jgi:hypothetical protein
MTGARTGKVNTVTPKTELSSFLASLYCQTRAIPELYWVERKVFAKRKNFSFNPINDSVCFSETSRATA